jgi:hypothetical protein
MNPIQISILYELFVFVYNVHLHEIVKSRKTAKKKVCQLAPPTGKLATDDTPLLQNFYVQFWKLATQPLVSYLHAKMPLKISDNLPHRVLLK